MLLTTVTHTITKVTTCGAPACVVAHGPDSTSLVTAGAAVVQALGAVGAIVAAVVLARGSAKREAKAQTAAAERERKADEAAERRSRAADAAAERRDARADANRQAEKREGERGAFNAKLGDIIVLAERAAALLEREVIEWSGRVGPPSYQGSVIDDGYVEAREIQDALTETRLFDGRASPVASSADRIVAALESGLQEGAGTFADALAEVRGLTSEVSDALTALRSLHRAGDDHVVTGAPIATA